MQIWSLDAFPHTLHRVNGVSKWRCLKNILLRLQSLTLPLLPKKECKEHLVNSIFFCSRYLHTWTTANLLIQFFIRFVKLLLQMCSEYSPIIYSPKCVIQFNMRPSRASINLKCQEGQLLSVLSVISIANFRRTYTQNQRNVCAKKWILNSLKHFIELNEHKNNSKLKPMRRISMPKMAILISFLAPSSCKQIVTWTNSLQQESSLHIQHSQNSTVSERTQNLQILNN